MLLEFTSLDLQPIFPRNTKFFVDIFNNDDVIDILVWVGLARKLPGMQYLHASCSMHAISRYCEARPKIIDFILFVGSPDVDHLKERLVEEWTRVDQKNIDG